MRLAAALVIATACTPAGELAMPDRGHDGIGFDDMQFSPAHGVIVPGGRTGHVDLIDPDTLAVRAIGSFSMTPTYAGGQASAVTSADDTGRWLIAMDRTRRPSTSSIPRAARRSRRRRLARPADYVRWVAGANESG